MAIILKTPFSIKTDDDLMRISKENEGYQFEADIDGSLIVSPTHTKGGAKSMEAAGQLWLYAKRVGGKAYDSQTGFKIGPGKRTFSPDASWLSQNHIDELAAKREDHGYWPISPDIVIEVKSDTDQFTDTIEKIEIFIERGSNYAVAINPETRDVIERGIRPNDLDLNLEAIIDA